MKKFFLILAMASAATVLAAAQTISLSDARARIGDCVASPGKLTATIRQLSASDQCEFLAAVNEAISQMPGSNESKAAAFLNCNKAALRGAQKGNLMALVAEIFATVPPEALTIVNERLAADMFNRAADPTKTYTDEQFTRIAKAMMAKVNERTASLDNGAERSAFAILMMVRASNGTPENLTESLVQTLPEAAQNAARNEWIPAALGVRQAQSYEPILGAADVVGSMPANELVIHIAGPQLLESLLGDVVEGTPIIGSFFETEVKPGIPIRDAGNDSPQHPATEPGGYPNQEP